MQLTHIAFTWWGSGGHISPIGSLIEYGLEDTNIASHCKLFRFGERDSLEESFAARYPEVTFVSIPAGKMRRYITVLSVLENIRDFFKLLWGVVVALKKLKHHQIQKVFCKGGYVSLPVCLAARVWGIPIFVHESDMHAGLTNRLVAKVAKTVFTGFPDVIWHSVTVWQLLSPKLLSPDKKLLPLMDLDNKTVVLVMGGSQGAAVIFDSLLTLLGQEKVDASFQFFILLGTKNAHYQEKFALFTNVMTYKFISNQDELAWLYQASDLAITRGAMTSLAEQQLFGIRKCIIPLPFTGGNHQRHNAQRCVSHRNDTLVEQDTKLARNLEEYLIRHVGYKKELYTPDAQMVTAPLQTIWSTLLPHH